jgi:Endonuclease-reverse transcriptase
MPNNTNDILQWNARNIKSNKNALEHFIQLNPNFKIIAISETHLTPNEPFQLLNYVAYRADRSQQVHQGRGGAALFLHPDIPAHEIHFLTNLEVVAVKAEINGVITTVVSIYVPPVTNYNQELQDLFAQFQHPVIICGDLNAHSTSWGAAHSNQRGKILEKIARDSNFTILNNGEPTLQRNPRTNYTAPDTTLVSDQIINKYAWNVAKTTLGSDHYLLFSSLFPQFNVITK